MRKPQPQRVARQYKLAPGGLSGFAYVTPAASPEGQAAISRELAAFDALPKDQRQQIAEAAYNLEPHDVTRSLVMDAQAQRDYETQLARGDFHSKPHELERIRAAILASSKTKAPNRRQAIINRRRRQT